MPRTLIGLGAAMALLCGCALRQGPPGSEVQAMVVRKLTPAIHASNLAYRSKAEQARDAATGLVDLAGRGRVVVTRCALSPVEVVFQEAVLPPGMQVADGAVLRVRLGDAATPDAVLGPVIEDGVSKGVLGAAEPGQEAWMARHYHRIRGVHMIRCTAGG